MKSISKQRLAKKQPAEKSRRSFATLSFIGLVALAAGCVERRVTYVPVYPTPPAYASSSAPGPTASPNPPPANNAVVMQAPPPPQVEAVPVAPGPEYVWRPGYWNWNGGWVWIGGGWVIRPHLGAVWVGGHWGRRGRGWAWMGGHWR
jgi:hypothetical protein